MAREELTGCPVPMVQDPEEFSALLERVRALQPQRILEVGSLYGGTLWHWLSITVGATVVSIDLIADTPAHPREKILAARAQWEAWAIDYVCRLHWFVGPSDHPEILKMARLHGLYDFIFIDGGHAYNEVAADFENYWPLLRPGGLMAFHDVASKTTGSRAVAHWWQEMVSSGSFRTEAIITNNTPGMFGIGLVWKDQE